MVLFTYHSTGAKLGSMPETEVVQQLHLPVTEDPPKGGTLVQDDETGLLPSVTPPGEGPSTKSLLKPFILSEGLPPVSYKLTEKILHGEFVNMAELLQRRASTATHSTPASAPQSRREVPDLLSWVHRFGTHMAIVFSKYPHRMKELLTYQTLIMWEACQCGRRGSWLAYDSFFRQQAVGDEGADWSWLKQSLYAMPFMAQGNHEGKGLCAVLRE